MPETPDAERDRAMQALTAEFAALSTARSSTVFDSSGRATLFLSTVSGSLVALAFVGNVTGLGPAFSAFALVLLPTLVFIGTATFARTMQSAIEDVHYVRGMNRIRGFYVDQAPMIRDVLVMPAEDTLDTVSQGAGFRPSRWQEFLTTAGMVEVVNSVLVGAFVSLLVATLGVGLLPVSVLIGVAAFAVSLALHHRAMTRSWQQFDQEVLAATENS
jgi:hypothetical protein